MKPEDWVNLFIEDEVLANESKVSDSLAKLVGEYCLYCYICSKKGVLVSRQIELLNLISSLEYEHDHFRILLDYCLGHQPKLKPLNTPCNALEIQFLRSDFLNEDVDWSEYILPFFKSLESDGLTRTNTYYLTHVIFYSTKFGSVKYWAKKPKITTLLSDILERCEEQFRDEDNWDLLREVYLCQLYIGSKEQSSIFRKFEIENQMITSPQGWCLSDGRRREYYERKYANLSFNEKYSLFHTTIISLVLANELDVSLKTT